MSGIFSWFRARKTGGTRGKIILKSWVEPTFSFNLTGGLGFDQNKKGSQQQDIDVEYGSMKPMQNGFNVYNQCK